MSSWIIAKNLPKKKKVDITSYHDATNVADVPKLYMEYLSSYIYNTKMGEQFNVLDSTGILRNTLRIPPHVRLLKEHVEGATSIPLSTYTPIVSKVKFKEVQKFATDVLLYDSEFNRSVVRVIDRVGIKTVFDIGIHLVKDITGPNLPAFKLYSEQLKEYQKKSKKASLSIYVMSDSYSVVTQFQTYCDPSWKIISLSKIQPNSADEEIIQTMADIQIMTALPAAILDFTRSSDRFIYMMQRNKTGSEFFTEVKGREWSLV